MLSIKALGTADSGVANYYEQLAHDDYYINGSEPPGQWQGKLASELNMFGQVMQGQLAAAFRGFHPLTGEALARNAGDQHKSGWDLTFSAPKSISVLWAAVDKDQRAVIEQAHAKAVTAALAYLEKRAFTSRDRGGQENRVQNILVATFIHGTSRELDAHLHTHATVANLGKRLDSTVCGLDFDTRYKMAGGAIYRAELASLLKDRGYGIERDGKSFKIAGIEKSVCDEFSKRRSQIVEQLQQTGFNSAKAASFAALNTRQAKQIENREALFHSWQAKITQLGLDGDAVHALRTANQPFASKPAMTEVISIDDILKELTLQSSTFTPMQFEAAIATAAQGVMSAQEIETLVEKTTSERLTQENDLGLVRLGPKNSSANRGRGTTRLTTREMMRIESEIIQYALLRKEETQHIVLCDSADSKYPSLSTEQFDALQHITQDPGAVKAVRGLAGTGKSHLLRAAKESWESAGLVVLGAALAGKAADSLEEGSGIKSQTLHSLLDELTRGQKVLTTKTILVMDEAGMIGSRMLHDVLKHVHATGAKAVLVGDPLQLQPIDAGGIFRYLSDRIGYSELTDIRRQELAADRLMINNLIKGEAATALENLQSRGLLTSAPSFEETCNEMVECWANEWKPEAPHESLMLAGTRADVFRLNLLARQKLLQKNLLHSEIVVDAEHGERRFAIGERILFTRNSQMLGVKNGQIGTLNHWGIDERGDLQLSIRTDSGKSILVNTQKYAHLEYGLAISVHKAQGATIDNIYVLLSEIMTDREWGYVAASRHRKKLHVFITNIQSSAIAESLVRSRQKDISLDYLLDLSKPEYMSESELEVEM